MQLCEATRIDEPIPVFRHREAMAKGNKEGIRTSDHQRAIAQLKIGTNGLEQSGVSPFGSIWLFHLAASHMFRGTAKIEDLVPDVWKTHHPEAVRTYRIEERQAKASIALEQAAKRRVRSELGKSIQC